jgi:hypothetical protein
VERPPHGLPQALDTVGVAPDQNRRQIARDQHVHGGAARSDRVGVTRALGALVVEDANGDQLEAPDRPVRAVGERDRQRNAVVVGVHLADQHRRRIT